jgi:hypothetical protein
MDIYGNNYKDNNNKNNSNNKVLWILIASNTKKLFVNLENYLKQVSNITIIKMEFMKLSILLDDNNEVQFIFNNEILKKPNCIYFLGSTTHSPSITLMDSINYLKYLRKQFELLKIHVINHNELSFITIDKFMSHIICKNINILQPKTMLINIVEFKNQNNNSAHQLSEQVLLDMQKNPSYNQIINNFNFPIILKSPFGGCGKYVWKIDNLNELDSFVKSYSESNIIVQEFISASLLRDVRVFIINNEIIYSYQRTGIQNDPTEFKSNISNGGSINEIQIDESLKNIVNKFLIHYPIEIGALDFLYGADSWLLCEISLGANLTIHDIDKKNEVYGKIVNYLVQKTLSI